MPDSYPNPLRPTASEVMDLYPMLSVQRNELGDLEILEGAGDTPDRQISVFTSWRNDDSGPDLNVWVSERQQGQLELTSRLKVPVSEGDYSLTLTEGTTPSDPDEVLATARAGVDLFLAYLCLDASEKHLVWASKVFDSLRGLDEIDFAAMLAGGSSNLSSMVWAHNLSPAENIIFARTTLEQATV